MVNQIDCGAAKVVGLSVRKGEESDEGLIESRMLMSVMALGRKCSALIDTGSMISIVPVGV
ncbi:hypothetical protein ANCCAN_13130 [Ancylostoma caninum]|uniref:Uncharacterized protein n=1 Tax=Ancylostoma caninum TaxID=29170 RepID=A0A368G948_ANCCA|nr:hypothetical protein ANCCAN_13130 [Ancylostoma caninum]